MIIVGRHINGIFLNDLEYLLNDDNTLKTFDSEMDAKHFLRDAGYTDDDMYFLVFEQYEATDEIDGEEKALAEIDDRLKDMSNHPDRYFEPDDKRRLF